MTAKPETKYPSDPWRRLAADPWTPLLDPVSGAAWDDAVASARQRRIAALKARESLARLQEERQGNARAVPGKPYLGDD
jgi:hypothetical protein